MVSEFTHPETIFMLVVLLLSVTALYCIMVSRNLIRILIGVELLSKALTLLLVMGGYFTGQVAQAQALVITLIVVEVVVIAVAAGIVVGAFQRTESLNTRQFENLKG